MTRPRGVRTAGGRRWTRQQLELALSTAFGAAPSGGPDTAAAAAALGVSRRTVQRYLHGDRQQQLAVPTARLEQIRQAVRPDPESVRQEQLAVRYAQDAISRIEGADGPAVLPAWRERRWLEPHLVAVLELPRLGLRQVTVSRAGDGALRAVAKRGKVLSHATVPSRFHATVLASAVLDAVGPWRIQTPPGQVKQGRTQTWSSNAPRTPLRRLAVTPGLFAAPSPDDRAPTGPEAATAATAATEPTT